MRSIGHYCGRDEYDIIVEEINKTLLWIKVFHITPFLELGFTLLTTHALGLYEVTKKFQRYRQ